MYVHVIVLTLVFLHARISIEEQEIANATPWVHSNIPVTAKSKAYKYICIKAHALFQTGELQLQDGRRGQEAVQINQQ